MSLNDPHWGRDSSDKEPKKEETKNTSNSTDTEEDGFKEPELRRPIEDKREEKKFKQALGQENDIEELWKDFNDKLSGILGQKSKRPQDRGQNGVNFNWNDSDDDSNEPPPRKDHPFQADQGGHGTNGGNGGNGGGFGFPGTRMPQSASGSGYGFALAALLIAAGAWLSSGFYIVPEGQRGVVTTFGKYTETTNAGFRWHLPYTIQDVELVDVSSVRKAEIGMKGTTLRLKEALMLTDDENIVDVMFNVQYRIKDGPGAEEFLFRTRDPMGSVIQTAESAMREVVGRKKMDSVLFESKQEIAEEVKKLMQEMLDRYHSGIQILSVAIQNAQPPEQVQAAFNDAVKAGQDRERQINEGEAYANDVIPKAKGLAERLRQEAEAYKSRVVSQAEGDASRFDQVLSQYEKAPKVTRDRMYVDTMQQVLNNTKKILVDSKSSNNLLYLPLDKLVQQAGSAQNSAVAAAPAAAETSSTAREAQPQPSVEATPIANYVSRPLSRTIR